MRWINKTSVLLVITAVQAVLVNLILFSDSAAFGQTQSEKQVTREKTILALRDTDPKKFVDEYEKYLLDLEKLMTQNNGDSYFLGTTVQGYFGLALFTRFTLHQPEKAILLYNKVEQLHKNTPVIGVGILNTFGTALYVADIYQYDLKDNKKAVKFYQQALDSDLSKQFERETGLKSWYVDWLTYEIAYLKTGKSFSGMITRTQLAEFYMAAASEYTDFHARDVMRLDTGLKSDRISMSDRADSVVNRKIIDQKLQELPRSHQVLAATFQAMSYLPTPESVLAYLEAQDPGRYWTASILSLAYLQEAKDVFAKDDLRLSFFPGTLDGQSGKPSALLAAAELFQKKTGIRYDFQLDQQFTGPKELWQAFNSALFKGDLDKALGYLAIQEREKNREILVFMIEKMPREELKKALPAEGFNCPTKTFGNDGYIECEIIRDEHGQKLSFPIIMEKDMDEIWRISQF